MACPIATVLLCTRRTEPTRQPAGVEQRTVHADRPVVAEVMRTGGNPDQGTL
jgi:hypothetical protein